MENKTKNLLCIPFALCLIGCVHAMVTEDASSQVLRRVSGEEVDWNVFLKDVPPGPGLPRPGAGQLVCSENNGYKLYLFVPEGTTESRALYVKVPDKDARRLIGRPDSIVRVGGFRGFQMGHYTFQPQIYRIQSFLRDFATKNKYGPNSFDAFKDAIENDPDITLERLRERFDLGRIALFTLHHDVFGTILHRFQPEDLHSLLLDMTVVLRWRGFAHFGLSRAFSEFFSKRRPDLLWGIIEKIPTNELVRMQHTASTLHRLAESGYAIAVGDLLKKMPIAEILAMDRAQAVFTALIENGAASAIVELLKTGPIAQFMKIPGADSVIKALAKDGYVDLVAGLVLLD